MPYERGAAGFLDEVHRYFPEWADRPDSTGYFLEADHNSYLAGGYAEEFGYRVRPDRPPIFPALLEDPERSRQWAVQIGCLHPGYPECARPADRGADHARGTENAGTRLPGRVSRSGAGTGSEAFVQVLAVSRRGIKRHALLSIAALGARLRIRRRVRDRGI